MTIENTEAAISQHEAFQLEEIECRAWADMYAAAPPDFARMLHIVTEQTASMTLISAALPAGLFNKTFLHGLIEPLDETQLALIKQFYASNNAAVYQVYLTPFSRPADARQLMLSNGFKFYGATDKIFCDPQKIPGKEPGRQQVEILEVNSSNMDAWAEFICATYNGLPNQPWLKALVNRKGWYHAVAARSGEIIAARSMYSNGTAAWLGIDAPIPGLMTDNFLPDQLLTIQLLQVARKSGVRLVNSCIEAVDPSRQSSAYTYLYELGFAVAYTRELYSPE
ncbi:MAG: hypothetical protein JO301_09650 [Chitinophagaceae bacterium]|nr:hypothetical protein [Chitinophagaceae bacterium]